MFRTLSALLLLSQLAHAQFDFVYDDSIPVFRSGNELSIPWGGGLNYAQFSTFDYDYDGSDDLFVFDRSSNNIRVFVQENGLSGPYYRHAYGAKNDFPNDVRYRATMVDYDQDPNLRADLFCYGIGGVKVYRNVGSAATGLIWETAKEILYSQYPSLYTNLYISSADIPAIVDVDLDGDVDILTFSQSGQHIEYHQNQSMELYGSADSLEFVLKNECWGKFTEDVNTNNVLLNDPNPPCTGSSIPNPLRSGNQESDASKKHSGSTVMAFDYDNSGVMDLLLGDVSFTNMVYLENGGAAPNTNSAMISQDPNFPSNTIGINMQLFPASYYLDTDFDGEKDLVVSPNAKNVSENETSVWMYKNLGSTANPNFIYTTNHFLQEEMIEHGTGSVPVLFDYDEDGLEDLFVANLYRYKPIEMKESTIAQYRNTGTAIAPEFTFVDYNYLNLDQEVFGLRSIPAFGDLDNDGDQDLLLGIENGTLVFYPNNSTGSGALFGMPQLNYVDINDVIIDVGMYAHPQIYDLNKDGLQDLVIGCKTGEIYYYQNVGTSSTPEFELVNPNLGNVNVAVVTVDGFAAPHFFELNDTTHLFVGSSDGKFFYYDSIDGQLDPGENFNLVSENYRNINVEAYSAFAVNDIDNDSHLNLFVGQDLGGLFHFEDIPGSNVGLNISESNTIGIYPNPVSELLHISSASIPLESARIYHTNGTFVLFEVLEGHAGQIDTSKLASGIYIVSVALKNGDRINKRLVK